jgi:hypothetical protein
MGDRGSAMKTATGADVVAEKYLSRKLTSANATEPEEIETLSFPMDAKFDGRGIDGFGAPIHSDMHVQVFQFPGGIDVPCKLVGWDDAEDPTKLQCDEEAKLRQLSYVPMYCNIDEHPVRLGCGNYEETTVSARDLGASARLLNGADFMYASSFLTNPTWANEEPPEAVKGIWGVPNVKSNRNCLRQTTELRCNFDPNSLETAFEPVLYSKVEICPTTDLINLSCPNANDQDDAAASLVPALANDGDYDQEPYTLPIRVPYPTIRDFPGSPQEKCMVPDAGDETQTLECDYDTKTWNALVMEPWRCRENDPNVVIKCCKQGDCSLWPEQVVAGITGLFTEDCPLLSAANATESGTSTMTVWDKIDNYACSCSGDSCTVGNEYLGQAGVDFLPEADTLGACESACEFNEDCGYIRFQTIDSTNGGPAETVCKLWRNCAHQDETMTDSITEKKSDSGKHAERLHWQFCVVPGSSQ